ncbi:hypothetical protein ACHAWF_008819 [Thalassiosira exigua]
MNMKEPPDGLCTTIYFVDFDKSLPPIPEEAKMPFTNDSDIDKFGVFVLNMLEACESGSIGGDACRQNTVLLAALEEIAYMSDHQKRIEHLLGLTFAIGNHGLRPFLERGDPDSGRWIFGEIAKQWKKFFDHNINDPIRQVAMVYCDAVQKMLKNAQKDYGDYVTKYNFNYIRIPRPKRTKAAQAQKENANPAYANNVAKRKTDEMDAAVTKKKTKLISEAMKLIERINAVEGVPEDKVFDSCSEVRRKMEAFLLRDGMTKRNLCVALGNINHNSLRRFLSAADQKQSGNAAYRNGYIFFEKLRIMEGKTKSVERLQNEEHVENGFDFSKPKGGRPSSIIYCPGLPFGPLYH